MVNYSELTPEQKHAVSALDRNVTLTAGAGTGKTTTLTARYLRMIEASIQASSGDVSPDDILLPENILTTTFTERAANELEESIRTDITDRISELDAGEFDAWRTVADELEHGYIHTLHGFCARLLREHALSVDGVDPGFEPIDEDETDALIDDTVGAILEEYESHEATRTLAQRFSRGQLRDVLTDLLDERPESVEWADRWADASEEEYLGFVETELHPIERDEAAERLAHPDVVAAVTTLTEIVENPPDIDTGGTAWQRVEGVVEILDDDFDDGVPSRRKQMMIADLSRHLTTSGDRYANYTGAKTRWNNHPKKDAFDAAVTSLIETLEPEEYAVNVDLELEANSFPLVSALAELTRIASDAYEDRKRSQNLLDFSDLISHAVTFLQADENEQIRQELREQFDYVMVDEFQDTDPRQWDLIKLLTASEKGTFDAENVFVVGDVKQSIYRFRNADVAQFQETANALERTARDTPEGPDTPSTDDQLSTNFRTVPTVLETINELFDAIFDEDGEAYEAAPQRLSPHRDDPADIGSVEYLPVPTDPTLRADRFDHYDAFANADPDDDAELEAMALAARLSQILDDPYQVYPEDTAEENDPVEPRPIEPSDVAILIRSRTHLKTYERALYEANVPYSVAAGIGFYETTEITALLNLFRALADPHDERALYAVLRSPLFGFTDDTLARLKIHDDPLWEALETAESDDLETTFELLKTWRQLAGVSDEGTDDFDGSWAAFLTRIIEDTGYLVSIGAGDRPDQAIANVEKFRQRLREWSDDGLRSLTTLVNRIEQRIELGGRESEAETAAEGVQILTIHDAKGMEFPFVVVPGIGRNFNDSAAIGSGAVEFEQVGDRHAVGMKAPSLTDPFEMEDTIAREALRERRRREERAEEKRVLYVACTRARDHLLLSGMHDVEDDDDPSLTNLEDPDPESASGWRDWVQPELLPDEVCAELTDTNHVERTYGSGSYRISLPTPKVDVDLESPRDDPAVELSQTPPVAEKRFRLSATDLASLLGGYGELQFDDATRTAYVEEVERSPDERHGEKELPDEEQETDHSRSGGESDSGVSPRVFGEMVHRICELRPPESQWAHLMEQTLVDEDADVELTADLERRVNQHAHRGIEFVDAQTSAVTVEQQYDELYVSAEFDHGEIAGYIDHLVLSPEEYHVIDYKTGSIAPDELEEDASYYENQMKAYAIALYQQNTGRDVRVSLVFTDVEETWEITWEIDGIEEIEKNVENMLLEFLRTC